MIVYFFLEMNFIGNIVWLLFGSLLSSLLYLVGGLVMCVTIIGIPFGKQHFKLARLSLFPFGRKIVSK